MAFDLIKSDLKSSSESSFSFLPNRANAETLQSTMQKGIKIYVHGCRSILPSIDDVINSILYRISHVIQNSI